MFSLQIIQDPTIEQKLIQNIKNIKPYAYRIEKRIDINKLLDTTPSTTTNNITPEMLPSNNHSDHHHHGHSHHDHHHQQALSTSQLSHQTPSSPSLGSSSSSKSKKNKKNKNNKTKTKEEPFEIITEPLQHNFSTKDSKTSLETGATANATTKKQTSLVGGNTSPTKKIFNDSTSNLNVNETLEHYYEPKHHVFFTTGNPNIELFTGIIRLFKHGECKSFTSAVTDNVNESSSSSALSTTSLVGNNISGSNNNTKFKLTVDIDDDKEEEDEISLFKKKNNTLLKSKLQDSMNDNDSLLVGRSNTNNEQHYLNENLPNERTPLVLVLAVPSFLSLTDFFEFIDCFRPKLKRIRILRDESPNKYMVLLLFDEQRNADSFYKQYNGKAFNSFDPEDCKIVFVKSVEFTTKKLQDHKENNTDDEIFNENTTYTTSISVQNNNELTPNNANSFLEEYNFNNNNGEFNSPKSAKSNSGEKGMAIFDEKKYEIPTCPVCLDRLDSGASGIITTLCNHQFHCDCLTKWGEGICPVCRYTSKESLFDLKCMECGSNENLWVCLTCGYVGCGRYVGKHAQEHYLNTGHTYSMEAETQRVWDYTGDGYVHRLVSSSVGGKLIEVTNPHQKEVIRETTELLEAQYNSKLDAILHEYNILLTQQLASQRVYYETKLKDLEQEKDRQIENLISELQSFRQNTQKMSNKMQKSQKKIEKQNEETDFLRQLNKTLIENQKQYEIKLEKLEEQYKKIIEKKDDQIKDLSEQVQDMLMHFQTQQQMEKNPEMKQATVRVIGGSNSGSSSSNNKRRTKK
ncbi:hypothetical protein ABK040_011325 [Willaertia magna]